MLVEMVVSNDTGLIALLVCIELGEAFLLALSADAACELHVLGHDGNPARMDGAKVGILEEADQVCLASFLQRHNGGRLEAEIRLEVLSNLTDKTLEGRLLDQEVGGLLITTDLPESNGSRAITPGLLLTLSRRRLASSLGGELLTRRLPARGLASRLLGASHVATIQIAKVND